ncbi:hypothetical protein LMG18091_00021 [Ralstonia wenshanensis]|uniref:Uncharacterized protein n=1 Tax=Ralstonia wenshanensis TaxID=2842456 RepID=A0AAD2AMJ9_9RALS|nr:hypothetical protein LMG18091_00021 [Ralstonia wenshanensis]
MEIRSSKGFFKRFLSLKYPCAIEVIKRGPRSGVYNKLAKIPGRKLVDCAEDLSEVVRSRLAEIPCLCFQ